MFSNSLPNTFIFGEPVEAAAAVVLNKTCELSEEFVTERIVTPLNFYPLHHILAIYMSFLSLYLG